MNNEELLLKAYDSKYYFDRVKKIKGEIEDQIIELMNYIESELVKSEKKSLNIFELPQTRIKSVKSFKEKIKRKDYINTWVLSDNEDDNRKRISCELTDLIGFRINCFFSDDEEKIYNLCKEYSDQKKFQNIECNFDENTKQKNGHDIFKWSGKYYSAEYDEYFMFEVQVKSLVHNLWGEVEHKTIYKNQNYDVDTITKKSVTENIFEILQASNKQLLALYNNRHTEDDLIKGLFYEYTFESIRDKFSSSFLACYYEKFFSIFQGVLFDDIRKFVSFKIKHKKKGTFKRRSIEFTKSTKMYNFPNIVKKNYVEYDLKILFEICGIIIELDNFDMFLEYLGSIKLNDYMSLEENETPDDIDQLLADKLDNVLSVKEKPHA